jgi:hypothetical protein
MGNEIRYTCPRYNEFKTDSRCNVGDKNCPEYHRRQCLEFKRQMKIVENIKKESSK